MGDQTWARLKGLATALTAHFTQTACKMCT